MVDRKIYYYKVFCNTDNKYVYVWNKTQPSVCPENISHQINIGSIVVIDDIRSNTVEIMEEAPNDDPTGGKYKCQGLQIKNITSAGEYVKNFCWVYPVSILSFKFHTDEKNKGDRIDCDIIPTVFLSNSRVDLLPNTVEIPVVSLAKFIIGMQIYITDGYNAINCGSLLSKNTENISIIVEFPIQESMKKNAFITYSYSSGTTTLFASAGEYVINVSSRVLTQAAKGNIINVRNGETAQCLGEVVDIDKIGNKIIIQNPITSNIEQNSSIQIQTKLVDDYYLGPAGAHCIGDGKIGGSYNKKLYVMRTTYRNINASNIPKDFNFWIEILY